MPNITLSVTEEVKRRIDAHPSIKWSSVVRSVIERKLSDFEEAERLASKSKLKPVDFDAVSRKISQSAGMRARKLLHESNS